LDTGLPFPDREKTRKKGGLQGPLDIAGEKHDALLVAG
jgi:hypothetical protein